MEIVIPHRKLGIEAHDELLRQWHEATSSGDGGFSNGASVVREDSRGGNWRAAKRSLTLDLSRVSFVDPYGLCGLVIFLNHLPDEALPVRLRLPGWPAEPPREKPVRERVGVGAGSERPRFVRATHRATPSWNLRDLAPPVAYLTRMGFWEEVGDRLDVPRDWIPVRPLRSNDRNALLDLTIMHTHDAISVMLRRTGEILQGLNYSVVGRGHILEVLSELCSNVLMHAQTDFGGVAAMQTYKTRAGARYVVMSIGDHGVGVRASLQANPKLRARLESDPQALSVAMQAGASRFDVGGHGGGLPRVLDIARRYGGRVAARSGEGAFSYNGSTDERRVFATSHLQGTQLRIALPESRLRSETVVPKE
jgi:hypothetical protein